MRHVVPLAAMAIWVATPGEADAQSRRLGASYGARLAGVEMELTISQRVSLSVGPMITAPHAGPIQIGVRTGVNVALYGTPMHGLWVRAETTALTRVTSTRSAAQSSGSSAYRDHPSLLGGILLGTTWPLGHRWSTSFAGGALVPLTERKLRLEVTVRLSIGITF